MKMVAVMNMKVMIRKVRKMKVMTRTLFSTDSMNSYTGDVGDDISTVLKHKFIFGMVMNYSIWKPMLKLVEVKKISIEAFEVH
eukprot:693679-Ditylum_brightwellii.AAC.1